MNIAVDWIHVPFISKRALQEMDELVMKRDLLMQEPDTVSESLSKLESIRNVQNSVRDRISQLKVSFNVQACQPFGITRGTPCTTGS